MEQESRRGTRFPILTLSLLRFGVSYHYVQGHQCFQRFRETSARRMGVFTELEHLASTRSYNHPRHHPTVHVQRKHVMASLCCVPLRDTSQSHGFVLVARAMGVASLLSSSALIQLHDFSGGREPGQSEMQRPSSPSLSSSTHYSRPSTPPTEESHDLSSPTFALPEETEESIRRRQQSDFASAEIGNRLLKGWAMLADECPRSTCYGIPLVRPPKSGRDKDPPKVCFS